MAEWVERFGPDWGLPPKLVETLNVVLDEALNNIIAYGHREAANDEIVVHLAARLARLGPRSRTAGVPFDPLKVPVPLDAPLKDLNVRGALSCAA